MRLTLFFLAIPALATVSTSSATFANTGGASPSFNHTCATGDNIALSVSLGGRVATSGNNYPTSVTWQSNAPSGAPIIQLTKNPVSGDVASIIMLEEWHMFNCPSGITGKITINLVSDQTGGGNQNFGALAWSGSNIDFTSLVTSIVRATGTNGSAPSVALTSGANDSFVAVTDGGSTNTFTGFAVTGGTANELYNTTLSGNEKVAGGYTNPLSAGSHTLSWTSNLADYRQIIVTCLKQFSSYPVFGGAPTHAFAQTVITPTSSTSIDSGMGDTNLGSGSWTKSALCSGSLAGGCNFFTSNDGNGTASGLCPSSYAVCMFKMTASTPTFAMGPSMTSYGPITNPGSTTCAGRTGWNNKSRSPFVFKGQLFMTIGCPNDAFTDWAQEGILAIAADLTHACNWATWQSNSNSCPNSGSSTGDAPSSDAGFQWPDHSGSLIAAMQIISTGIQGDPCFHVGVGPPSLPTEFVYAYVNSLGIARFPCSVAAPMDPTNWTFRKSDGTWSSNRTDIASGSNSVGCNSVTWDRFHGSFLCMSDVHHTYATAALPWGPWTIQSPISNTDYQFLSLIDPLFTISAGRITGMISLNGPGSSNFRVEVIDLGPPNPVWSSSH